VAGCTTAGPSPFPEGKAAYSVIPESAPQDFSVDAIKPGDRLAIRVFGEPELTSETYIVDSAGYIQIPLIGEMIVVEQTPRAVAAEIERRLQIRYIKNASVTVTVMERPMATFAVEGDVNQPGVYPAQPNSTLLSALAQARSATKTAQLNDVVVLRKVNGERAGARFNVSDIRRGRSPDPQILAGDTVVVVNSSIKSAWRDLLQATPVLSLFYIFK